MTPGGRDGEIDLFPESDDFISVLKEKTRASILYSDINKYLDYHWQEHLYPYQKKLAELIINPPDNRRIAAVAPRQTGKSTTLIYTILYLLDKNPHFKVGVFAPKEEQAKGIIFKGIRDRVERNEMYRKKMVRNSQTHLELANGSIVKAQAASLTAKIMGNDLDIAIVDEAQDVPDIKIRRDIIPMLAARNGLLVLIGTASTKTCYFYESLRNPAYTSFKINIEEAKAQNSNYCTHVEQVKLERGEDDVLYRTQYMGEWVLEKGMFVEPEDIEACEIDTIKPNPDDTHFAGFDPASGPDRSVFTILNPQCQLVNIVSFEGDDFPSQYVMLIDIMKSWNVKYLCVDSTGPQNATFQMLRQMAKERNLQCVIEPRFFDALNKHKYMTNLKRALKTRTLKLYSKETCPENMKVSWYRLKQELLDLEVTYKDYIMKCEAPNKTGAHDDFCMSAAIAVDCYNTFSGAQANNSEWLPILSHDRTKPRSGIGNKRERLMKYWVDKYGRRK